jgi:hypothetical protein
LVRFLRLSVERLMLAERSHSATDFQGGGERESARLCVCAFVLSSVGFVRV